MGCSAVINNVLLVVRFVSSKHVVVEMRGEATQSHRVWSVHASWTWSDNGKKKVYREPKLDFT